MSFAAIAETAFQYWEHLDTPVSLGLYIRAKAGQWLDVLTFQVDVDAYLDDSSLLRDAAAASFLKKNPHVPGTSVSERKTASIEAWRQGERACYWANERLFTYIDGPLQDTSPAKFLRRVRSKIYSWLGNGPGDESLKRFGRHGPGTTVSSGVHSPTAADKYADVLTVTRGAVWHLANIVGTKWTAEMQSASSSPNLLDRVKFVRGNRFTSVPKTALTDRGIGIEASLNVYFQLSVGRLMRDALRRSTGWDLNNVQHIHREVACRASADGSFATIDLSNASDTLCKNLVKILFNGTRWLDVMDTLRSTHTYLDGKWHLLEKFSSMGNGYTFELETVIFAAICSTVLELKGHSGLLGFDLFVFGDDIIVPTDCYELVSKTLAWLGFTVNPRKSFHTGFFRESCGGDFYNGHPVRGFYLKTDLDYGDLSVFTVHNGIKVILDRLGDPSPRLLVWLRNRFLPSVFKEIGGSERLGDSVLHGLPARQRWERGIRWVKVVRWTRPTLVKWSIFSPDVRLACRLTGHGDSFGIYSRGSTGPATIEWVTDS